MEWSAIDVPGHSLCVSSPHTHQMSVNTQEIQNINGNNIVKYQTIGKQGYPGK